MGIEQKREEALNKLIEAKSAYSQACSDVQKIIKRYPVLEMRSPEVLADLAVKRWIQGKAQKARMIAQAEYMALKPTPEQELDSYFVPIPKGKASINVGMEVFRNSPMFKEMAQAALRNRPEFKPPEDIAAEFDFSSLESEPIQCGELRTDLKISPPVEREVDPLEEFDPEN